MKTDRAALLWGTVIAVAFAAVTVILVFKFPDFQLPLNVKRGEALLASASLFLLLIACYRKLWKRPGFWVLLAGFLGIYWAVVVYLADQFSGFGMDALYGITGAAETAIFGLVMARLYHRGPEVPSWVGLRSR